MLTSLNRRVAHMFATTMNTLKPTVWMHEWLHEDPDKAWRPEWLDRVKDLFEVVTHRDLQKCPGKGAEVQGAIINPYTYAGLSEQLTLMPSLKVIANFGVGVNHIDIQRIRKLGIKVTNTPDVLNSTTADMAMTLLLASARDLIPAVHRAMDKTAMPRIITTNYGVDVTGSTLGIVGLGGIGMKIAERARGFDMNVVYHNRRQRSAEEEARLKVTYCPRLLDMLPDCDFVMVSCPLTEETRHLFGKKEFMTMKKTAAIINIARGDIIDQDALVDALQTNEIRGAALDVTSPEPLPRDHPLLDLPNVVISPHIGTVTYGCRERMVMVVLDNLKAALLDNVPMPNEIGL